MRTVINLSGEAQCPCGERIEVLLWSDPDVQEQPIRWRYTKYCAHCGRKYTVTASTTSQMEIET